MIERIIAQGLKGILIAGGLYAGKKLIDWMSEVKMYASSEAINDFYRDEVRLTEDEKQVLRDRADANYARLKKGLREMGAPQPVERIKQGSYAMHTLVYHPINGVGEKRYDLDQGVAFDKEDLIGARGAELTPLEVRKMVCAALQDEAFSRPPEVRQNCVRVFYKDGIQIDIPCYRVTTNWAGSQVYELAGPDWKMSNPKAVTDWFNVAVTAKSPDSTNGRQMRRVVRLIKKWCKSRKSWNMPSGLIISKLVDEVYAQYASDGRDDLALLDVLQAISNRLAWNKDVEHPVISGGLISKGKEAAIRELKSKIDEYLPSLQMVLDNAEMDEEAMAGWDTFFNTDYFGEIEFSDEMSA